MRAQHQQAIAELVRHFQAAPGVLSVILGGSVAKGVARANSDIDAMVILDDDSYRKRERKGRLAECISGRCGYQGGYFDVKYFPKSFLVEAAARGSEPTRHSFVAAKVLFSRDRGIPRDQSIPALVRRIGRYPIREKQEKLRSFYAAYRLNKTYFWNQALERQDPYLLTRTAAEIILFGSRLLLAHNHELFPCQAGLLRAVRRIRRKPKGFLAALRALAAHPCPESKAAFCRKIDGYMDWTGGRREPSRVLTRFVQDNEWWWWKARPLLAEW